MANDIGNNIPSNAVEILFLEDFINWILYSRTGEPWETWRAELFRDFVYNAFSGELTKAVDYIDKILEWEIDRDFSKLAETGDVNKDAFANYAYVQGLRYIVRHPDADSFLHYCVRLSSLASYFVLHDVLSVPEVAFHFMLWALETYNRMSGSWDTLKSVAKKYVKINEDLSNTLTPEVSDDESMSEDEIDESEDNKDNAYYLNRDDGLEIDLKRED